MINLESHDCHISPEDSCDCQNVDYLMQIVLKNHDNLFNANHRTAMINKYGYTDGMSVTIEDLIK